MSSQQSESARTEQIITQFQLKALQAILGSRIPNLARPITDPARARRRDRWFNLALGDLPSALENPSHGVMDPMVVDVILSPADVILERWTAAFELPQPPVPAAATASAGEGSLYRKAYKKSIVLLRSLYSLLRLLPCFKIFKMLTASNQSYNYDLSYRVSSFAAPFSREEERELSVYSFDPIDTQFGQLSLTVSYRPSLSEFNFEVSSLMPAMIIADYVGSPAADPMRAFPALPAHKSTGAGSGSRPISYPLRGITGSNSPNSPAVPAFQRPHSWSEVRSAPMDVFKNRIPSQKATGTHKKGAFSFDEYRLSPPMSNSPTPSPPAYGSSGNSMQSRLRSETAPVSIPAGVSGKTQLPRTPNHSDPMRSFLPPPSPRSTRMEQSSQESQSSESRSFRKSEGLKLGDFYSNLHLYNAQKGPKDGRDDSGRFSGVFSSSGSPRLFSRSSSRLSIPDDLDDIDFSCPFAVDDVDTSDSQSRNLEGKEAAEYSQSYNSSHKSQDAAVGALVHMLRTAAPLRQDQSYSSQSSRSEVTGEVGNSSYFMGRKTSDALEELKSYREMKEVLLSQSRVQLLDSVKQSTE